MSDWKAIGTSLGTGAVAGVLDQVLMNQDEKKKREAAAGGESLSIFKQMGTYYNYVLPMGIVVAAAAGAIKGAWLDRLVTIAGQLAGRKGTAQVTKAAQSAPWKSYTPPTPRTPPTKRTYQPEFEPAIAI